MFQPLTKKFQTYFSCAGGSGRTGMVVAAVVKNLGLYDPVARIRRVKSTYVETFEQELFLKNMPKAIDSRIVRDARVLAMAIAAEHLIQVFHTHGSSMEKSEIAKDIGKLHFVCNYQGPRTKVAFNPYSISYLKFLKAAWPLPIIA